MLSKDHMLIMVLISRMCQKTCFDLLNQMGTEKQAKKQNTTRDHQYESAVLVNI